MLPNEKYDEVVASEGLVGLYMDPKMSRNQKEYVWLLQDMEKRSMIACGMIASVTIGKFAYKRETIDTD